MIVLCLNDTWIWNIIYYGFVPWWSFSPKSYMMVLCLVVPWMRNIIYDGFVSRWPLNGEKIYLMVLNLETLHEKYDGFMSQWPFNVEQYMFFSFDDPWTWNMTYYGWLCASMKHMTLIYNGLVPWWPLNAKYYIW
jgi:hypothetical protein